MLETSVTAPPFTKRAIWPALLRGLQQRCPACGVGRLYGRYLKVAETCPHCGEALHHQRADDAPPYITMLIVGHVVIGSLLSVEMAYHPETWVHMVLWGPITLGLSLWLLPRVKGALIGLQWAARMHGFGRGRDPAEPEVWPPRGTV
jgi:uncharacterized protein (DUF983 family)